MSVFHFRDIRGRRSASGPLRSLDAVYGSGSDIPLDFLPIGSTSRSEENATTTNRPTKDEVKPADEGDAAAADQIRTALLDIEPELRQIEGVLKLLSILGEAGDSVEPVALAALARAGQSAFEQLSAQWRSGFDALREPGRSSRD